MPLNSGEVFAGYVIQRLLGTGGMGEVYLAQHPRLPRQDALKILSLASTADREFRARFIREAELAATLRHPHIVGVLDRGEFNGQLWISMDYVDGTDAGRLIRESYSGGMPEQDVSEIVTAVADALDFGHERRLLHRDVKPENILVTASDGRRRRVLFTDFGIARRIDDVSNLTDDNVAVGTISYIAPEQLMGKPLDGRADQYALAATTFHLLTGAPPFQDSNRAVVISQHLGTPPPRISDRRPDLAHLDAVLARALAKDANERYPNCLEFAEALTQQGPRRDVAHRIRKPIRRRRDRAAPRTWFGRPSTNAASRAFGRSWDSTRRQAKRGRPQISGTVSFQLVPYDPIDNRRAPIPVEIQTQLGAGQLADGDEVEVSGVWDGNTLDADEIVSFSADAPPKRRSSPSRARIAAGQGTETQKGPDGSTRRTRRCHRVDGGCGCVVHRRIRPLDSPRANHQASECNRFFTQRCPGQSAESRLGDRRQPRHIVVHRHLQGSSPVPEFRRGRGTAAASVRSDRAERRHYRLVQHGNRGADPLIAHRNPGQVGRHDGADANHATAAGTQPHSSP